MRPRDLSRFDGTIYDVLVVGGGIHGLACAYEAASRGLRVALVEAADFGSGASFNHQKTAHGGLRSLGAGHLQRARESIRERRALAQLFVEYAAVVFQLLGVHRMIAPCETFPCRLTSRESITCRLRAPHARTHATTS